MRKDEVFEKIEIGEPSTIEDVIEGMEALQQFLGERERYRSLLPFLKAYYRVTSSVQERKRQGFFDHPGEMDRLDVVFARRYFEPVKEYLDGEDPGRPWSPYFDYCRRNDSMASLEMMLGINVHINADLAPALEEAGFRHRKDYDRINEVLESEIVSLLRYLVLNRPDRLNLAAVLMPMVVDREFRNVIVRWRDRTWENREAMDLEELQRQTCEVSRELVEIGHDLNPLNLPHRLKELERLEVSLDRA
ncbi:MAG: DUF5995 family protein [Candidatus Nanohaloarchaea archaeon]